MVLPLGVIWAQGQGGALGEGGRLPWHVPEDMAAFKALTLGHTVAMGRVTWEGLPQGFRPLPGRRNIVLSRHPNTVAATGAEVMTLEDFLQGLAHDALCECELASATTASSLDTSATSVAAFFGHLPRNIVWVIGGALMYTALLPYASWAAITSIDVTVPHADAFAPQLPESFSLREAIPASSWARSTSGLAYRFSLYFNDQPQPLPASKRGDA